MKFVRSLRPPAIATSLVLAVGLSQGQEAQEAPSRIVILGAPDIAMMGQDGYCGSMVDYSATGTEGMLVEGGRRTWLRLGRSHSFRIKCAGDASFTPQPGKAYVVRFSTPPGRCLVELFRMNPGGKPIAESLREEEKRSCLLPWNHTQPASATSDPADAITK